MNTCVETIPSQVLIEPATQKVVAPEPVAQVESEPSRRPVSEGNAADIHHPSANQPAKRSWFSIRWPSPGKIDPKQSLLTALPVGSLPGVGQTHARTLVERGVTTVGQLRRIPKPVLVAAFGQAIGKHIWESARSQASLPR
jgi:hypothetical protein